MNKKLFKGMLIGLAIFSKLFEQNKKNEEKLKKVLETAKNLALHDADRIQKIIELLKQ